MVRKLASAAAFVLATLAQCQTIHHDAFRESRFPENRLERVFTDLIYRQENGTTPYPQMIQVVAGQYVPGANYNLRGGFIAWEDPKFGVKGRYNIPLASSQHQLFVNDISGLDLSGKRLAYITGSLNTNGIGGGMTSYPVLQVFEWTGSGFVPVTDLVRISPTTTSGWYTKIASDNKGNFYTLWEESLNILKFRKFRFKSTSPYYEFIGPAGSINPRTSPLQQGEVVEDVDVAFSMGGKATFVSLSKGPNFQRILSWQLDDFSGRLSDYKEEFFTNWQTVDSISVATHWKPNVYTTWPFQVTTMYPEDYMIAYSASDSLFSSINTVGVAEGARVGPNLVNIFNREVLGKNRSVQIAGSDLFYEVVWSFKDSNNIFSTVQADEILSQTLDINGGPTQLWPRGHKLVNSNRDGYHATPSVAIGRGYGGNGSMAVAYWQNLTDPLDDLAPPKGDLLIKIIVTAYY